MKKHPKTAEYTRKQVAKIIGRPARTIQFWTDQGLVIPEIDNPVGRGTKRKYSERNLKEFEAIKQFSAFGLSLKTIKIVMAGNLDKLDLIISSLTAIRRRLPFMNLERG